MRNYAESFSDLPGAPLAQSLLTTESQDEQFTRGLRVNDEEVAASILAYLAEHPKAMDSLEGIASWWIMRHQVRVNVMKLTQVLGELTERGLVEEIGEGEQRRYRLKR